MVTRLSVRSNTLPFSVPTEEALAGWTSLPDFPDPGSGRFDEAWSEPMWSCYPSEYPPPPLYPVTGEFTFTFHMVVDVSLGTL